MLLTNEENVSSENQTDSQKKRNRKEVIQYLLVVLIFLIVLAGITALSMLSLDKIIDETTTEQTQPTTKSSRDIWLEELSKKVPYVDLAEEFIGDTALGKPAETLKSCVVFYKDRRETTTRPPTTTKKKNSGFDEYDDDHFNVDDYYDAEDFYYDNMDEFYDFYDAEDYFNEYHS